MSTRPNGGPTGAQKAYYLTVLRPMWRGQQDQLGAAERNYRHHLLALECLRVAKGPGPDALRVAEFCRKWKIPMTTPVISPTAFLRRIGKAVGGWPSKVAVFDPSGAISLGTKLIGHMAPLLGKLQMREAALVALDPKVIEKADTRAVGSILESCHTPQQLISRVKDSKKRLERVWKETVSLAEKMEPIRKEIGLRE